MQHSITRKILTSFVIIFGLLTFATFIMGLGGGGVLNDLYSALEEIEDLEKKKLLGNPPQHISDIAKREIKLVHNSVGLRQYIKENEETLAAVEFYLPIFTVSFFLTLFLRIYFRKKKKFNRVEGG